MIIVVHEHGAAEPDDRHYYPSPVPVQRKFVIERLGRQVSTLRHEVRRLQMEARGLFRGQVGWDDPCLTYEHLEEWFAGSKPSRPAASAMGPAAAEREPSRPSRRAEAAAAAEAAANQTRMRVKR